MAEQKQGLGSRSAVMFVAFAVDRALGFLLIILITRWWAPVEVGYWTQAITLTGALGTIASMGLYQAHIRFAEESTEPRVRHSLQLTILSVTTAALLVAAAVAAVIPGPFSRSVFGVATETRLLAAVFALAISELWAEFVTVQLRAEVDARGAAFVMGGKALLRIVLIGGVVQANGTDVARTVAMLALVQWLAAILVMVGRLEGARWPRAGFAPARQLFRRALSMALPMIPAGFAAQGFVTAERFLLARTTPETMAHFNVGQQFAANAMMAYVILGSMLYPLLVRAWREGREAATAPIIADALVTYALVSLPALFVLPLVSRELLPLLTTRYYEVSASSFLALMIGTAGFGVFQLTGYIFYVTERTWDILALLSSGFAIKVILGTILVSHFGERGAVLGWAISGAFLATVTVMRARMIVAFPLPIARLVRPTFAAGLAAALVGAIRVAVDAPSRFLLLGTAALALGVYVYLMRRELIAEVSQRARV